MVSFTAFQAMIIFVYIWFAIGIVLISVFAIRELWIMLTSPAKEKENTNCPEADLT